MSHDARTRRTYDRWSRFYDRTFAPMTERRIRCAVGQMGLRPGDRVLDIGVGTGTSLGLFPDDVSIVGMDLSAGMLRRARRKCRGGALDHVHLVQGDALMPPFAEGAFDHIFLTHVVSVVRDPVGLMDRASRLVRPGGRVVMVNHFESTRRAVAAFEKALNPLCLRLGWRTDVKLADVVNRGGLRLVRCFKMNPLDVWQIVVLARESGSGAAAEAACGRECLA